MAISLKTPGPCQDFVMVVGGLAGTAGLKGVLCRVDVTAFNIKLWFQRRRVHYSVSHSYYLYSLLGQIAPNSQSPLDKWSISSCCDTYATTLSPLFVVVPIRFIAMNGSMISNSPPALRGADGLKSDRAEEDSNIMAVCIAIHYVMSLIIS